MNLHSIAYYLLLIISCILIFSCDEVLNPVDCTGVAGGSAITDDCGMCTGGTTNKLPNYLQDCAGECNGDSQLDCEKNCRSASYYNDLGDGYCDTIIPVLNCEEYNCDNGDCGTWNGSVCMGEDGLSAIKYEYYSDCCPYSIYSEDPSIPQTFQWDYYYPAITGTYSFSYIGIQAGDDEYFSGYYTTFVNEGEINNSGTNICFKLTMYNYVGPSFYDYNGIWGCTEYYEDLLGRTVSYENPYDEIVYQRFLQDQTNELNMISIYGNVSNSNILPTITRIDNPLTDVRISEIDNDPNVVVQEGENYIMKYVKKEIPK